MKKNRQFLAAFIMIIVSFSISTIIYLISLHSVVRDDSKEVSKLLAARINDAITSELTKTITVAKTMASDYFLIEQLKNENTFSKSTNELKFITYLNGIIINFNYESAFVVSDSSKNYYTFKGFNKKIDLENDSHDIWYKNFLEQKKQYDLDVDMDEMNKNNWTLFVNTRICDFDGRFLGVCGVGVEMTKLQSIFSQYESEYDVKINLVNKEGLIQVDTDEIRIENAYLDEIPLDEELSEEFFYTAGKKGGNFTISKYIPDLGWYLVVSHSNGRKTEISKMIVLNAISLFIVLMIMGIALKIILYREQHLVKASETDQMTNLFNRRSYENEINRIRAEDITDGITIGVFDINCLKSANDTLGHAAGDELIKAGAEYIRRYFSGFGKIFRTGGDEFVLIGTAPIPQEKIQEVLCQFKEELKNWKGKLSDELSVSVGIAQSTKEAPFAIKELVKLSDKEMYKDKELFYRTSNKDRRR